MHNAGRAKYIATKYSNRGIERLEKIKIISITNEIQYSISKILFISIKSFNNLSLLSFLSNDK